MFFSYYCLFYYWVINIFFYISYKKYSIKSFNAIDVWLKELKQNSSPDVKIFLVGNKVDLEDDRVVTTKEAKDLVNDLEMDFYMETSAKTGFNAENIFIQAAKLLYKEYKDLLKKDDTNEKKPNNKKLDDINKIIKKKKGCC